MKIWMPTIRAGSGADVFTQRLAEGLQKAGHVPVVQWFEHRYEAVPWLLRKCAPPQGTDIVHAGSWQGFVFKRDGLPLIVTEHNFVWHPGFLPHRGLTRAVYHETLVRHFVSRTYAAADALVAASETTANAMRSWKMHDVSVVHNWVDSEKFQPLAAGGAQRTGKFKLLFVGNPSRWKGSDLVAPLSEMLGEDFEIVCLGGLRSDAREAPGFANVVAHARVAPDCMPDLYRSVDAALVLARYEAFGYVALEAMASGLPVVGFDTTGTAEVCKNGETALLSDIDDLESLAANVKRLAADSVLYREMSQSARQRAISMFSEEVAINRYLEIYARLAAKAAAS
jgi:glycosyltransferase involved in cell wall biosynthesis